MTENDTVSSHGGENLVDQKIPALDGKKEKKFPVVEMFGPTIEGEGALIGEQTFFIRFGLCDYKCGKCDSMHAVNPNMVRLLGEWQTASEIAHSLRAHRSMKHAHHITNVTFSGGNPAIHDLQELVDMLHLDGLKVFVETQGSKSPDWLKSVDHVVVSPKSPGMGETFNFADFARFIENILVSGVDYSIKIVVFSAQDLEFAAGIASIFEGAWPRLQCDIRNVPHWKDRFYLSLGNPKPPQFSVVVDPEDGKPSVMQDDRDTKELASELLTQYNLLSEDVMKDHRLAFARFLPQLHVLVYGNETGK